MTSLPTSRTGPTRRVRLVKPHIHAGFPQRVGDEIDAVHHIADWLIAEGAAIDVPTAAPTATPSSTTSASKKDK